MTAPPKEKAAEKVSAASARTEYRLGMVLPHVALAAFAIGRKFGISQILGWRASAKDMRGHPAGLALDVMVSSKAQGDPIKAWLVTEEVRKAMAITYILWQQTEFSDEAGWDKGRPMEDRGSDTQNHRDHLHVNFSLIPGILTSGDGQLWIEKAIGQGVEVIGNGAGAVADAVMPDWFGGVQELALKLLLGAAAIGLVVVGAKSAVNNDND